MADQHDPDQTGPVRPTSGNRWEPDQPRSADDAGSGATAGTPSEAASDTAAFDATPTTNRSWRERVRVPRGRGALAGAAAGALLIGGLGGFGAGYAVADHGGDTVQMTGFDGQRGDHGGDGPPRHGGHGPWGDHDDQGDQGDYGGQGDQDQGPIQGELDEGTESGTSL